MTGACAEIREQTYEHVALSAAPDERARFGLLAAVRREGRLVDDEVVDRAQRAGRLQERIALVRRDREPVGEALG